MVKRYEDFSQHVDYMEQDSDGTWVKYEDYKKLQKECEHQNGLINYLKADIEAAHQMINGLNDRNKKLEQECEALKAENERLSKELEGVRYCALWDESDRIEVAARAIEWMSKKIDECAEFDEQHKEIVAYIVECMKDDAAKIRNGDIEL